MTIFIPTPLRPFANGQDSIEVTAPTVAEALGELTRAHPGLRKHLFTGEGKLRAFVNLYLNDEDVRYLARYGHRHALHHSLDRRGLFGAGRSGGLAFDA
jgi:molybdopterin synthase sulfur carrier subunit